jgi:GT2 family glycosyltransferase
MNTNSATHSTPPISIAICTYARGAVLLETLHSILPHAIALHAEILVVDQRHQHPADIATSLSRLTEQGVIRWIVVDTDSLTGKRNIALAQARAGIVLFLDDDVIIPRGFLEAHINAYADPVMDGMTGQVFHAINASNPPMLDHPEINSRHHFSDPTPGPTRSFIGCNHSVRRSCALSMGGYDERFIASSQCEDFDFADRLADAGHSLWYDPKAWLIHLRATTGGTRGLSRTTWPEWTRSANIFLYAFRHGKKRGNLLALINRALRTGPLRREIITKPWRWPTAWLGCVRGAWYGWHHRRFQPTEAMRSYAKAFAIKIENTEKAKHC